MRSNISVIGLVYILPGHITSLWGLNHCWLVDGEIFICFNKKQMFKN